MKRISLSEYQTQRRRLRRAGVALLLFLLVPFFWPVSHAMFNGTTIPENEFPEVVREFNGILCTSFWIAPNAYLSAAHCFGKSDDVLFHPEVNLLELSEDRYSPFQSNRDLALKMFSYPRAESFLKIAIEDLSASGQRATLVGFGKNEKKDGNKRKGKNHCRKNWFIDGLLECRGGLFSSLLSKGDSGSPLIINGRVAGVYSFDYSTFGITYTNFFENLRSFKNQEFLRLGVKKGAEIPASCCRCQKRNKSELVFAIGENEDLQLCEKEKSDDLLTCALKPLSVCKQEYITVFERSTTSYSPIQKASTAHPLPASHGQKSVHP